MKKEIFLGLLLLLLIPFSAFALFDDKPIEVEKVIEVPEVIEEVVIEEPQVTEELSLDEILLRFDDAFDNVNVMYGESLQEIIVKSTAEYRSLPYDDRIKMSVKTKLISKYISEIEVLENNVDNVFYYLIDEFKEKLVDNGYDVIIANEYIDGYKNEKKLLHRKFLEDTFDIDDK